MGNKRMSKELEKICEESFKKNRRYNPIKMVYVIQQQAYEEGFQAAIESEQVQGLVEALEVCYEATMVPHQTRDKSELDSLCNKACFAAQKALEKFRGEE